MKNKKEGNKISKIIVWILVFLIILVGFIGIYIKRLNKFENIIPDYTYGMDIYGCVENKLEVDTTEQTKEVFVDSNGKICGEVLEGVSEVPGYEIEEMNIKANSEEILTSKNFEKTKEIIEKRLNKFNMDEYVVKIDDTNGNLIIQIPEGESSNTNYSLATTEGKITIEDAQTGVILMDNSYIKNANAVLNQSGTNSYDIYLQLSFTKEGAEKLNDLSKKYIEYKEDGAEETKIDYISIKIDDEQLRKQYFSEEWTTDYIYIPIAQALSSQEEINEAYSSTKNIADILNIGKLPIKYVTVSNNFVQSTISEKEINIFKVAIIIVLIIIAIIFIAIYKIEGLKIGLLNIGFVALYSLIIRFLRFEITLPSVIGLLFIIGLNTVLLIPNKKIKFIEQLNKFNITIIPILILSIVFILINSSTIILSIGTILFWGIVVIEIYNYTITNLILRK